MSDEFDARSIVSQAKEAGVRLWVNPAGHLEADPKGDLPRHLRAVILRNLESMKTYIGTHATIPSVPVTFDDYVHECTILKNKIRDAFPWPDVRIDDNNIEFLKKHYKWLKEEVAKPPVKALCRGDATSLGNRGRSLNTSVTGRNAITR